ncbi:MAG: hypothetical protein B6U69_02075 [Thermofilum sp. ex4484_15]|nr:MAG: hypothetical protein B6U69_02075 [Thermofilum sp. ex4484_15]
MRGLVVTLNEEEKLRIKGPAKLKVNRGSLYLLGRVLSEGREATVAKGRIICTKAIKSCEIKVLIGEGGGVEKPGEGEETIDEWSSKLPEALVLKPVDIVILGDTDTGKSTAVVFLANLALSKGFKVAVIDGDVGQNDLSPPSSLGLAFVKDYISSLRELRVEKIHFVGSITPSGYESEVIYGLIKLSSYAIEKGVQALIINTDGWVRGSHALKFKLNLIRALNPKVVVGLQRGKELEGLLRALEAYGWPKVIRLNTPPTAPKRDHKERKELRGLTYTKYFTNCRKLIVDLNKVPILNFPIFRGEPIQPEELGLLKDTVRAHYCERMGGITLIVVDTRNGDLLKGCKMPNLIVLRRGDERGIIAGLLGEGFETIGLGIIEEVDYQRKAVKLITPVRGEVKGIIIGRVKVLFKEEGGNVRVVEDLQTQLFTKP